jgi:hypothetical protein
MTNVNHKGREVLISSFMKMLNFEDKTSAKGNNYQARQCTYNVTPRRVRGNIVAAEKQEGTTYSKCVFAALPSIHNACAIFYCHLWLVRLYHVFPNFLINGTI